MHREGFIAPSRYHVLPFAAAILFLAACSVFGAKAPFEKAVSFKPVNEVDRLFAASLDKQGLEPAGMCSDEVFIRRVYLDIIGTLPQAQEVVKFIDNPRPDKRRTLINQLLESEEFADYWSLKWCDILRVKAEFPINLWPNAVQAYHRWVHDALKANMPYDQFARELLTSSGSNFRVPQVNFYRAIQGREPSAIASAVALTFMGSRIENWSSERREGMAAFFSRVAYKGTAEWKEEIIYLNPAPVSNLTARFPDGKTVQIAANQDPRAAFADWLITAENPWFSRAAVNRVWAWLFGRGIIHQADDIREDNPPAHPEVLAFLEKKLAESKYDLREIYRVILNSSVYQQSSIARTDAEKAEKYFTCYPVRQLDAEVLIDAICMLTDTTEEYSSPIPEPFTWIPVENRSIELADGSITSQFLEMFGRPSRDTGVMSERDNEPSSAQRREILNSTHIQRKIEQSWKLAAWIKSARGNRKTLIKSIYVNVLSRYPTQEETAICEEYFESLGKMKESAVDIMWALINSKEFLYRH